MWVSTPEKIILSEKNLSYTLSLNCSSQKCEKRKPMWARFEILLSTGYVCVWREEHVPKILKYKLNTFNIVMCSLSMLQLPYLQNAEYNIFDY